MAFPKAQKDLEEALIRNLEGVKQKQAEIVKMWFDERKQDAKVISRNVSNILGQSMSDRVQGFLKMQDYIDMLKSEYGYKSIYVASRDGIVLIATEKNMVGSNIANQDYCRDALGGNVFISGIRLPERDEREEGKGDAGNPVMLISAPLNDADGLIAGAVVIEAKSSPLSEIMKSTKLGKSGETFLINRECYMLTESRFRDEIENMGFIRHRTALELRVVNPHTGIITDGALKCLSGKDGYNAEGYINYNGRKVLGAWCWISEYNCGLLAQIDIQEGYGAAYGLKKFVFSMLSVLAFPLVLIAFYFGRRISTPILRITEATKKIAGGDLKQRVKDYGDSDEIRDLSQAFNMMAESLEEKTYTLKSYTSNLENTIKERTAELQKTTTFLNSILAGSTEYSIIAEDLEGNILAFNKGASLIYGYKPEEMAGKANVKILHTDEDVESGKVDCILEEARRTGRYEGEVMRRRKNGEIFPAHVTFTLRRDVYGQPIGFVVISKDITKEKLVMLEKEVVNNVNKMIISSLDIREIYKNMYNELKRIVDFAWLGVVCLADRIGVTEDFHILDGTVLPNDWLHSRQFHLDSMAHGIAIKNGVPVFVKDTLEFAYPIDPMLREKGICSYVCFPLKSKGITIGSVILGSKKTEAFREIHFGLLDQIIPQLAVTIENTRLFVSIRESEEKYRDLVENAPEMIHEISPEGKFINVNKTELNKLGYSLEEMKKMTLEDIVPHEYREEIRRHTKRIIETGSSELEAVFLTKTGKEINVEMNGTGLYNNKTRECVCTRSFVRDITERKRMEEQVRRAEKLASMGELAAAIAHEIRNPLGAICNSVGILDSHLKLTGQDKNLLEMILGQSERLDRIISDFLTFAHPREPSFSFRDIREVIKKTIFLLEQDSRCTDQVEIKEVYESVLPKVYIDEDLIYQVLWNLFVNSLDAMPHGGQIRITVRKTTLFLRGAVEIIISDTGIGIPAKEVSKVFEPFYTTKSEGTGLGLSTVQRIIDDHGGTVDVKSKEGKGATFYIKLPGHIEHEKGLLVKEFLEG
jgi:PAS domain S-box-containing protein